MNNKYHEDNQKLKQSSKKRRKVEEHLDSTPSLRKFNDIDLNDPDPQENWKGMVSKSRRTYFDFQYLRKCKTDGFHKTTETKSKKPGKKPQTITNFLFFLFLKDDRKVYMNLKHPFTVAYFGKYLLISLCQTNNGLAIL